MADLIRAAGVVVLKGPRSKRRVLLVHRPRHLDWSLPKGKLQAGELDVAAAVRECDEETGIVPILGPPLGRQSYKVMGRAKTVDYWSARVGRDNKFTPDDEVDRITWATPEEARGMLTYQRDRQLMDAALSGPRTWPLVILRHTQAEKRAHFRGRDFQRPLAGRGRTQAKQLIPLLAAYGITSVISSTSRRCVDTVRPFAVASNIRVRGESRFSEEATARKPKATVARMKECASLKQALVVCSHRPVLPLLLGTISEQLNRTDAALLADPLEPGGMVVFHRTITKGRMTVVAVERHNG
jgi:8-oxo-dGTP diphosphatase